MCVWCGCRGDKLYMVRVRVSVRVRVRVRLRVRVRVRVRSMGSSVPSPRRTWSCQSIAELSYFRLNYIFALWVQHWEIDCTLKETPKDLNVQSSKCMNSPFV